MIAPENLIKRETLVSIVINVVISLAFFWLVFADTDPIPVWGVGNYVFDLIPQTFMITLMSVLVPGTIVARKLRAGNVGTFPVAKPLLRNRLVRAIVFAVSAVCITVVLASATLVAFGIDTIPSMPALASKLLIGGALAAIVTPLGLARELAA